MSTFADYALAAKARDVITKLVIKTLNTHRPAYKYATVVSWNTTSHTAIVTPNGQTTTVKVAYGRMVPTAVGNIVRIDGLPGDRFISDVLQGG